MDKWGYIQACEPQLQGVSINVLHGRIRGGEIGKIDMLFFQQWRYKKTCQVM